jgi:predicted permease
VLLVSAGLLMRTVLRVVSEERGFDADHAMAMRLMLTQTVRFDATERAPFVNRLVTEVRALPGVVAAGVGSDLPPNSTQLLMTVRVVREDNETTFPLSFGAATPGYLEALGARLLKGRLFEERDRLQSPPVAVVSEGAARAIWGDREPIGREWPVGFPARDGRRERPTVIGVIRDIKYGGLDRAAGPAMFAMWERLAPGNAHLVVRTSSRPEDVASAVRRIVQDIDPTLPLFPPKTLDEVVSESIAERRLRVKLAAGFAALALALAAVALWGAVAQSVLDRRHELAVRMALGATTTGAVRLMLRTGVLLIAIGLVLGGAAGAAAARALRHLLHGVSPADPVTFAAGVAIATLVSLAACYVPARRAASISPAELLRQN